MDSLNADERKSLWHHKVSWLDFALPSKLRLIAVATHRASNSNIQNIIVSDFTVRCLTSHIQHQIFLWVSDPWSRGGCLLWRHQRRTGLVCTFTAWWHTWNADWESRHLSERKGRSQTQWWGLALGKYCLSFLNLYWFLWNNLKQQPFLYDTIYTSLNARGL